MNQEDFDAIRSRILTTQNEDIIEMPIWSRTEIIATIHRDPGLHASEIRSVVLVDQILNLLCAKLYKFSIEHDFQLPKTEGIESRSRAMVYNQVLDKHSEWFGRIIRLFRMYHPDMFSDYMESDDMAVTFLNFIYKKQMDGGTRYSQFSEINYL